MQLVWCRTTKLYGVVPGVEPLKSTCAILKISTMRLESLLESEQFLPIHRRKYGL